MRNTKSMTSRGPVVGQCLEIANDICFLLFGVRSASWAENALHGVGGAAGGVAIGIDVLLLGYKDYHSPNVYTTDASSLEKGTGPAAIELYALAFRDPVK